MNRYKILFNWYLTKNVQKTITSRRFQKSAKHATEYFSVAVNMWTSNVYAASLHFQNNQCGKSRDRVKTKNVFLLDAWDYQRKRSYNCALYVPRDGIKASGSYTVVRWHHLIVGYATCHKASLVHLISSSLQYSCTNACFARKFSLVSRDVRASLLILDSP